MLASWRDCLGYSNVYCDVRKRWFLAWNQNRHITYYIFHIQYTNSEISIGLLYICPHFVLWHRLNHCVALVRNLPTSILVRASVSLLTFHTHTSTILSPLWFTRAADSRTFPFPRCLVLLTEVCWLVLHGMVEAVEQHRRFSVAVWKKKTSVSIQNQTNIVRYINCVFH